MDTIISGAILVAIWMLILIWVIRFSVISAMRRARHEARVEKLEPDKAKWLYGDGQSSALRARSKS